MARLVRYDWPGNVRQLSNVARQLVVASHGRDSLAVNMTVKRLLEAHDAAEDSVDERTPAPPSHKPEEPSEVPVSRSPSEIKDSELVTSLRKNRWRIAATARQLGISKTSLYGLIERSPSVRKARDISREELLACRETYSGELEQMSGALEVSVRALQLRLRELELV